VIAVKTRDKVSEATGFIKAERDENTCRKQFAPSEAVALGQQLEKWEVKEADKRKAEGNKRGGQVAGKLPATSKGVTDTKGLAKYSKIQPAIKVSG